MRILFVNRSARFQGGIEADVHVAAGGLAARGHECHLLAFDPDVDPAYTAPFASAHIAPSDEARALAARVDAVTPALVYLHKVEDASVLGLHALMAPPHRVPVVRFVHDHDLYCMRRHRYLPITLDVCTRPADLLGCLRCGGFFERSRDGLLPLRWRPVTARLQDLAATRALTRVLVASRFMAEELRRNDVPERLVRVVPLGVPDSAVPPPATSRGRVAFVGQLLRTKGVDLLLRALAETPSETTLDVVGDGAQQAELRELAECLGVGGRVAWHGRLDAAQVTRVLGSAAIVAFPSRWPEPFGLVGLEAMRASRPVVAFDVGGVREWLEHGRTGLVVPPGDTLGFARALRRLVRNPAEAHAMGNLGRASYERTFHLDRYLDRLERHLVEATLGAEGGPA